MMKLDLNKLAEQVDDTILKRGKAYFEEGAVTNIDEYESNKWYAVVVGSESYEVEIHQVKNKINYYDCSCPYEYGPVCKHVVATIYAIKESKSQPAAAPKSKTTTTTTTTTKPAKALTTKKMVQEILDNVSYPELKAFLLAYALKKNEFGTMLLARFPDQTGIEGKEKYELILDNAFKAAADRTGFIEYANRTKVLKPVQELLAQAKNLFARKYYSEVVLICQAIIEKIILQTNNLEETGGKFEDAVDTAFSLLVQLVKAPVPVNLKENLFSYVIKELPQVTYHEMGFAQNWLELADMLAIDKTKEDHLIREIRDLLHQQKQKKSAKSKGSKHNALYAGILKQILFIPETYNEKQLTLFLANFLAGRNRRADADNLIEEYKHLPEFREILINRALTDKNYALAKKYVLEILASDRKTTIVDENKWVSWLMRIAEQEQDIPGIRQQALKLYYSTYNPEYLLKLKEYYSPEMWPDEYKKIVQKPLEEEEKKANWSFWGYRLAPTFIALQDWPRLFHYISKRPTLDLLLQTSTHFPKSYSPQLLEMYRKAVQECAAHNTNKSSYQTVAKVLKQMLLLEGGKPVVEKIISNFREIYKRRFALIAELNKVKFDK